MMMKKNKYCCYRAKINDSLCDQEYIKIKNLFQSVLIMAGRDAFLLTPRGKQNKIYKTDALRFLQGGEDLQTVCEFANVSDQKIMELMKQKLNNNLKYRKFILIVKEKK